MSSPAMLRTSSVLLDKSMFAAKRRVIVPIQPTPGYPAHFIKASFTTDPLKEKQKARFSSGGDAMREVQDIPKRLEGQRSRAELTSRGDEDFAALIEFIQGASYDQLISGRRFRKIYEKLSENDDMFVWLCHTAMAVLNPGDMRSRLMHNHLKALAEAVASGEMTQRTAFRFFESAVRSPAYREIAARQLETGAATRLAGLAAAADVMREMGLTRRPMSSYFELYQRIVERSEAMTPWGFPPLFQFEERLALEPRLKFFSRAGQQQLERRRRGSIFSPHTILQGRRIFWIPPTWNRAGRFIGPHINLYPGLTPD
ncbi:conserved hypothetical protein [Leishmania major strain Friedlin]|uniref:Uncharacterized protein n=3 Tax=Leishmania TaxID=38568 RepID=E9ACG9_LEIMA|nr:conserved hypothetical protein [Leishmania infantum JPCM5]XP_003721700.1 conserved hypothetical protein [Leishmania major strain Friedlin]CAC9438845.1 hypothetical_protein_-_conserved [Leishmania infantum]CAG9567248.1 hypothetical_protein_-_conserved [Leishmania major strain Friedlin]CAM59996.1 conserved hypothetical protein [Leishmania infantum JPCM5]CBZ11985.1 conserved hypothetical protein [Leishmania major strain Friedlin]SUZ38717.1 hypothetical_protein_-_conserved [Leishmania infantum|eukprot:XP_003721700.1 conserved hypothetical protein [Leishmania major strain Friedlin]